MEDSITNCRFFRTRADAGSVDSPCWIAPVSS
jgi:hypothetical protein